MKNEDQKIVDAIVAKSLRECPDALDLVGVYGSAATGDTHERSDLDLLILIGDEKGRVLADGFILKDTMIGYDIYPTTWNMLLDDAQCNHPHLSKLLDSKIIYIRDKSVLIRLEEIQSKARETLSSRDRIDKALSSLQKAKVALADCYLSEELDKLRINSGIALEHAFDSLMLLNGRYYKLGTKRKFEELASLDLTFDVREEALSVINTEKAEDIRKNLSLLIKNICQLFENIDVHTKEEPCKENICGTYEEIFSNWRGKMHESEEKGDVFSSFVNMLSFQFMLDDIFDGVNISRINVMEKFTPHDLHRNTVSFENALDEYLKEYKKASISPKIYNNVDEFTEEYLKGR